MNEEATSKSEGLGDLQATEPWNGREGIYEIFVPCKLARLSLCQLSFIFLDEARAIPIRWMKERSRRVDVPEDIQVSEP